MHVLPLVTRIVMIALFHVPIQDAVCTVANLNTWRLLKDDKLRSSISRIS